MFAEGGRDWAARAAAMLSRSRLSVLTRASRLGLHEQPRRRVRVLLTDGSDQLVSTHVRLTMSAQQVPRFDDPAGRPMAGSRPTDRAARLAAIRAEWARPDEPLPPAGYTKTIPPPGRCRWVEGDAITGYRWCGSPVVDGTDWCRYHLRKGTKRPV